MSDLKIKEQGLVTIKAPHVCAICHERFPTGTKMMRTRYTGPIKFVKYICRLCDTKVRCGEINVDRKYNIGDKVKYHTDGTGNPDIDGWVGTVIYVDTRDYTVEFQREIYDGVTDYRARDIGIEPKFERGWFCREEHLEGV
jgi:hypothetical protein